MSGCPHDPIYGPGPAIPDFEALEQLYKWKHKKRKKNETSLRNRIKKRLWKRH